MPEELEEQAPEQFDLSRYLDIAQRRYLHFLIPFFLGWLIVWGASWVLTPRYKSGTLILVDEPSMPANLIAPNVNDNLQDRLQNLQQQILSRTRLLTIINKLDLFKGASGKLTPDQEVDIVRKSIDLELVRDTQNQGVSSFRISYSAADPHIAQQTTNELAKLFINENSRQRETASENATQFIQNQVASARASLAAQDEKVHQFQAAHEGELPDQAATNLQILNGLQAQLQNEEDSLNTAKQQRVYYQSLIQQYQDIQESGSADGEPAGLAAIDQQLDTLRKQLANLRTRYTDRYPEVQNVISEIARTEAERRALIGKLGNASGSRSRTNTGRQFTQGVPTTSQLQVQSQLQANQTEIANREHTVAGLRRRIDAYQARLNDEPIVAQQLADLTRGYEQSKENFNDLLKKENESQMATRMEHLQAGERFTVLDPPDLPVKPYFPKRLKMCAGGIGAGIVLGAMVVFLFEFLDDRIYSDKELRDLIPANVISEIPEIVNRADQRRNIRKIVLGWAIAVIVFGAILCGSAFSYLHG